MAIDYSISAKTFFDSGPVMRRVGDAERRVLSKFGSFVRRTAQTSMRPARRMKQHEMKGKVLERYNRQKGQAKRYGGPMPKRPFASSDIGKPPRTHTKILKRNIFFGYDTKRQTVIIGPAIAAARSSGEAPRTLEEGGTATVMIAGRRGRRVRRRIRIAPRPFMGPARDKELPKLPKMWKNSVTR